MDGAPRVTGSLSTRPTRHRFNGMPTQVVAAADDDPALVHGFTRRPARMFAGGVPSHRRQVVGASAFRRFVDEDRQIAERSRAVGTA